MPNYTIFKQVMAIDPEDNRPFIDKQEKVGQINIANPDDDEQTITHLKMDSYLDGNGPYHITKNSNSLLCVKDMFDEPVLVLAQIFKSLGEC